MSQSKRTEQWSCPTCQSEQPIEVRTKYFTCQECASTFRIDWRSGIIESSFPLNRVAEISQDEQERETLQHSFTEQQGKLQTLNEKIRRLEMSKGGERLRVLSIFVIICAAVFILFRITVTGVELLVNPGIVELSVAAAAAVSLFFMTVIGFRKSAIVRACNKLLAERAELQTELEQYEAALDLHKQPEVAEPEPTPEPEPEPEPAPASPNIIEQFAVKRRSGKRRLSIREDEE